jgi:hypothetical protein
MIQKAIGVPYTIVNGEVVIDNGVPTAARSGKVLRPTPWTH